ncbi:MAG TPA: hypothetical protein VIM53_01190 [Candidatus Saccharimonadales bacterium]
MKRSSRVRPLLIGQIGLIVGLLTCFVLKPQFLKSEGGFSNYGVTAVTVPFFTLAFLFAAVGTFMTAQQIARTKLAWSLRILALLFFFVLVSTYPYKVNGAFDDLHKLAAILLFVWEVALSVYFVRKLHDAPNVLAFALQFGASLAALITFLGFVHLLFVSQFVEGAAFGVLLVRSLSKVEATS